MSDQQPKASDRLRAMADRLDHNADAPFGGCAVIAFPGGEVIEVVSFDSNPDVVYFASAIATRLQELLKDIETKKRQGLAYGR